MANTRDLRVNIDGDPKGIDRAFASAKASAEVFERELEKLERQQRQQEESLKRAEVATKAYGRASSDAAEKATRLGHAAAEAGDRAARSSALAKEAADKLARGELDAEEAAKAEARALRDVERAAIATAVAQRASAKAAQDQAKQEKQAARDAVVAAATQRLEHLRAAGAVKEHNQLLTKLRKDYKEFDKGFDEMKTAAGTAFTFLKNGMSALGSGAASLAQSLGPGMVAIILAALAVLPAAATLIGGGLVLALGGAFAAIGLDATKGSAVAQHALALLKHNAVQILGDVTKPFEQTWVNIGDAASKALTGIAPDLKKLFASLAPEISAFANQMGSALPGQLHGFFMSLHADFGPIISELGAVLPEALGRAADGIKQIMDEIASHPQEFGNMISATGHLVGALATMVTWLIRVGEVLTQINALDGTVGAGLQRLGEKAGALGAPLTGLGALMQRFDMSSKSASNTLTLFGANMATAGAQAGTLQTTTGRLVETNKELKKTLQALLDPALAYSNDQVAMTESSIALAAALKASHGQMGLQTAQSRAATLAFNDLISKTAQMRQDEIALHGSTATASTAIREQVAHLWKLAGNSSAAQDRVLRLAASLNIPLPASARKSKGAIDGVHQAMNGLQNKRITVTADTSQAYSAASALQRYINSIFGHAYGGPVGHVPGMAAGGPVQRFPGGGSVHGAGSSTSDSIPTMLSNGEFVVNAKQTAQWLPELIAINKGMAKTAVLSAAHTATLSAAHQSYLPNGLGSATSGDRLSAVHVSKLTAGKTSVLPPAIHATQAGGGAVRVDIYLHPEAARGGGVMAEIVRELKYDVRIKGGGSAQVFFGQR